VKTGQDGRAGPDMIGQRRKAEVDPLARIAFALPIQRLMLQASQFGDNSAIKPIRSQITRPTVA
jgi:hypothetical protein